MTRTEAYALWFFAVMTVLGIANWAFQTGGGS